MTADKEQARPRRRDFLQALLRTFSGQGSWNQRTLMGAGLTHALAPLLRRIHGDGTPALHESLARHSAVFNSHPYLAPIAVGALAREEAEGMDPDALLRFRAALQAPLGALGDQLIWVAWRPLCTVAAAIIFLAGAPPTVAVIAFLTVFNAVHLTLRIWGLRLGWKGGRQVGAQISRVASSGFPRYLGLGSQLFLGVLIPILVAHLPGVEAFWLPLAVASTVSVIAYLIPKSAGAIATAALFTAILIGFL